MCLWISLRLLSFSVEFLHCAKKHFCISSLGIFLGIIFWNRFSVSFFRFPPSCILIMHILWKSLSRVWLFMTRGLYSPWNSPGQNTGVGSLSLLQGIFPTQGSNPGLPHCRWILICSWATREAHVYIGMPYVSYGAGNGNPLQYSYLENSMDRGVWWATVHGIAKSQTRLSD